MWWIIALIIVALFGLISLAHFIFQKMGHWHTVARLMAERYCNFSDMYGPKNVDKTFEATLNDRYQYLQNSSFAHIVQNFAVFREYMLHGEEEKPEPGVILAVMACLWVDRHYSVRNLKTAPQYLKMLGEIRAYIENIKPDLLLEQEDNDEKIANILEKMQPCEIQVNASK